MTSPSFNVELNASTIKLENAFKKASDVAEANMAKVRAAIESSSLSATSAQAATDRFIASLGKSSNDAAFKSITEGAKHAEEGMEKLNFSTVGARRELLVLAHEASQGNWKNFGGSLLVLGERVDAMSLIFSGAGVAVLAAGAAITVAGVAFMKGREESDKLVASLKLTGNFAGLTEDGFRSLAHTMSEDTHASIGKARDALSGLIGTGQFVGGALRSVGDAAVQMARLTGGSAEDIVKDFSKMADGVAKWAEDANNRYHFLSAAQFEHIRILEEQGRKQEAMQETGDRLNDAFKKQEVNLGYLERAWHSVGDAAKGAWEKMMDGGRVETAGDKIKAARAKVAEIEETLRAHAAGTVPFIKFGLDKDLIAKQQVLYAANMQALREANTATDKAEKAQHEQSLIEAGNYMRKLHEETASNADKRLKEIKKYNEKAELLQLDAATREKDIAAIKEKWKDAKVAHGRTDDPTKEVLDDQLQAYEQKLAMERDQLAFSNKYVEELHKQGLIDQNQYEDYRAKALESGIGVSTKAYAAEIELLKKYQADAKRETDKARAQKRIDALSAKMERNPVDLAEQKQMQSLQNRGAARQAVDGINFSGLKKASPTDDAWNKWIENDKKIQKAMDESAISQAEYDEKRLQNAQDISDKIIAIDQKEADAKAALQQSVLSQASGVAGDMYQMLKNAGQEKTALAKSLFLAEKAFAVAEIIMNTNVAAAKAGSQLGIFGIPMEAIIMATGYARAGMVAGMAIAEASAESGFDIPAGVNPMTQLHEKEMVLPKAQAEVIRGLAGRSGGGSEKITIINQTTGRIDKVVEQRISPTERALIIQEAVNVTASTLSDPNSRMSKSMSRNLSVQRSR